MTIRNTHQRIINQPIEQVAELFETLTTKNDCIWPKENWPAMRFDEGIKVGSKGGHGRIRYTVVSFEKGKHIVFEFTKPDGFEGTHELNLEALSSETTEISHNIKMNTRSFKATVLWITTIRWLHDALIEDAFDKVENQFSQNKKTTRYSIWVQLLRDVYKRKSFKIKHA